MKWISEAHQLPKVGQPVLLAHPKQDYDLWEMNIVALHIRHEGVTPKPVAKGSEWPTEYHWSPLRDHLTITFVTGNSWWAQLDDIELPPGAVHVAERGFHLVRKTPDFRWVMPLTR